MKVDKTRQQRSRRTFLRTAGAVLVGGCWMGGRAWAMSAEEDRLDWEGLQERPVLDPQFLGTPLRVKSVELLRRGGVFLVRVVSEDGLESVTAPNSDRLRDVYPLFVNRVAPFFVGKDVCGLERHLEELYRRDSNYKLQGLALWVGVAAVEMGMLDLLGKARGVPLGRLFGPVLRREIEVYRASGNRGNTPEEELDYLRRLAAETGARALKFRLGGRMSRNADSLPGRTEALIPMVREAFGPGMTLYADANSSYDVVQAVRIGRMLEEHAYAFFEEPVPFDALWETQAVARALAIPVAGGEQEFSLRRFRWVIANRGVDVVQPDLHYFGGYIRCTRVARMAAAAGMDCTPHMSGSGIGYVNVLHFASVTPNVGAHQEFKGEADLPCACATSSLRCVDGKVLCPTGPGMGVEIDPEFVASARRVTGG